MASSATKSILSLTALLFFLGSTVVTGMGIFELNRTKSDKIGAEYLVPAAVANSIAVIFLIYLTTTIEDKSTAYKLLIIVLLIAGLVMELYLSLFSEEKVVSVFAYIVMAINFFFRGFLVLEYIQLGEWVKPTWGEMKPAAEIAKSSSKPTEIKAPTDERVKLFKDQWREILDEIKLKNPNVDSTSTQRGWNVINSAAAAGDFGKDKLREAMSLVKNTDGSEIAKPSIGGRKRS